MSQKRKAAVNLKHLKKHFALWAIRAQDVSFAQQAWTSFRRLADQDAQDPSTALVLLTAFVAAYGRIFSGHNCLQSPRGTDGALHRQIMKLRHQGVAHSDLDFRRIRLAPPGAIVPGLKPRPAHELAGWNYLIHALTLHAEAEQVENWIKHLRDDFAAKADKAFQDLYDALGDRIIPATELTLDEI